MSSGPGPSPLPVMPVRVFYSWQSDLPGRDNRSFIEDALERAAKRVTTTSDPIEIQVAARGEPGSPDIAQTIFGRIAMSDVFVADVSLVGRGHEPNNRRLSNPNVLIETGYAAAVVGWERVILVHNTSTGAIEHLPFDVRGRVIVPYEVSDSDRAAAKAVLVGKLEVALRGVLQHGRRLRGATWVSDAERDYRLTSAEDDLAEYDRICQEWQDALAHVEHGGNVSIPIEVLEVENLRRCLDIARCELDIEDGGFLRVFLRQAESFNRMAARVPIGSSNNVEPTLRCLRISAGTLREQTPRVVSIIAHARAHDRTSGWRAPVAPGDRPYTLDDEVLAALAIARGEELGAKGSS